MSERLSDKGNPRGMQRWLLRLPIWFYRLHLGRILGDRFLMLVHTGRKSGQLRQTVLEVVDHDAATDEYVISSGWGDKSDWLRNIRKNPDVQVQTGGQRFPAIAEQLSEEQARTVTANYAHHHPAAFRALASRMIDQPLTGTDADYQALAQAVPFVILRPKGRSS